MWQQNDNISGMAFALRLQTGYMPINLKIRTVILLFGLLFNTHLHAADKNGYVNGELSLKITPSSVVDPWGGMLPIGLEYGFSRTWSASYELGVPLFYKLYASSFKEDIRMNFDIKSRVEFRKYFLTEGDTKNLLAFIGFEAAYRKQKYHINSPSFYYEGESSNHNKVYFNDADVVRMKLSGAVLGGMQYNISGGVTIEWYMGIGLSDVYTHHSNVTATGTEYNTWARWADFSRGNKDTDDMKLYLTAGVKVGIRL